LDGVGIRQPQACANAGIFMAEVEEEEGLRRYRRMGGVSCELVSGGRQGQAVEQEGPDRGGVVESDPR
jgi:hypothetical protein